MLFISGSFRVERLAIRVLRVIYCSPDFTLPRTAVKLCTPTRTKRGREISRLLLFSTSNSDQFPGNIFGSQNEIAQPLAIALSGISGRFAVLSY